MKTLNKILTILLLILLSTKISTCQNNNFIFKNAKLSLHWSSKAIFKTPESVCYDNCNNLSSMKDLTHRKSKTHHRFKMNNMIMVYKLE